MRASSIADTRATFFDYLAARDIYFGEPQRLQEPLFGLGRSRTGLGGYALSQLNQNGLLRAGTGATLGGVAGRTAYPLALFAASRFGTPALKAVNAVANSPVGKWGTKFLDAVF